MRKIRPSHGELESLDRIREALGSSVLSVHLAENATVEVRAARESLTNVAERLRSDPRLSYDYLSCLSAVDYEGYYEVAYHLHSLANATSIRLKVRLDGESPSVDSVSSLWPAANWHEREAYDLFGVHFDGHPNLERIMLEDGFEGHPMRKSYPQPEGRNHESRGGPHPSPLPEGEGAGQLPEGEGTTGQHLTTAPLSENIGPSPPPGANAIRPYRFGEGPNDNAKGSKGPTWDVPEIEAAEINAGDIHSSEMVLNMGPQHPSTHGVLRLLLKLNGEVVVDCKPVIGYLHRGIEKILERRTYLQGIRYVDQFDYVAGMLNEHSYAGAIEQLAGIEVPRRGEYLRIIVDEMSRIASHLVWLGAYLLDLGAFTPIVYAFRDREVILDFFEELCGSRMNFNYHRVGGVLFDFPQGYLRRLEKFLDELERNLDEYEELVSGNEIFLARTVGVGIIPAALGVAYGISGPAIRASGVEVDIRTYRPYGAYRELGVFPQVRHEGDAFARYQVRLAEVRESIRLVRCAIASLPGGPVRGHLPHVLKPPRGETYFCIESSKGELGVHLISDGQIKPYRAKIRPPSFVNLQILPELVRGRPIGDVIAIFGSIDVVLGEVDR